MSDVNPDAKTIFLNAIEQKSPEDLLRYLDEACDDNAEVRLRVEELLQAHQDAGNFLGGSPATDVTIDLPVPEKPGTVIGPYKLLQEIGEGGMGVVYMAEQTKPVRRRVALKIIKPGMDTKQVIARFEAERQALAMMDHPNIAKVFDAGTTESGRPFFVMELVKGVPITEYSDEHDLTTGQRLELFIPVCQAVQHAHQKAIIHRDIKPSNVLVCLYDGKPVPKVIDFGLAKAMSQSLTEKTMFTQFGQVVGTLEYMSPEQAERSQFDLDTRSDIYSLGVLLYELLTGKTPLDRERLQSAAFDEMLQMIREEEPPKPSLQISTLGDALPSVAAHRQSEPKKLSSLVRGDLDWIVMKALEKDRTRRYETAKDFAADLTRHMEHEPVEAGPPSIAYRLSKFMKRHTMATAVSVTIIISVLLGLLGTSSGFVCALQGWSEAERNEGWAKASEAEAKASEAKAINARISETESRKVAERSERKAQWNFYASQMKLVNIAHEDRRYGRVGQLLEKVVPQGRQPDFRGWEYAYYRDQCNWKYRTLSTEATRIRVSPKRDELAIFTRSDKVHIQIWRTKDWTVRGTFKLDDERLFYGSSWSVDGILALACKDGTIVLFDMNSGEVVRELNPLDSPIVALQWSPDSRFLALAYQDGTIVLFDMNLGEVVCKKSLRCPDTGRPVKGLAWSPDSKRLATTYVKRLWIWDTTTWKAIHSVAGPTKGSSVISWSPDGTRFAAFCGGLVICDRDGRPVKKIDVGPTEPYTFCWLTDEKIAVAGKSHAVFICNAKSGDIEAFVKVHNGPVHQVLAMINGRHLITRSGREVCVSYLGALSPALVFKGTTEAEIWHLAWGLDGNSLFAAATDGHVYQWCTRTGTLMRVLQARSPGCRHFTVTDSGSLVSVSSEFIVTIWDSSLENPREVVVPRHIFGGTMQARCARVSPDGRWLTICPFKAGTRAAVVSLVDGGVVEEFAYKSHCIWTPDSSEAGLLKNWSPTDSNLQVWDVVSKTTRRISFPYYTGIFSIAFNQDGGRLALGLRDGRIQIVDCNTCEELLQPRPAHTAPVTSIAWAPDGNRIASTGKDGLLKILDSSTLAELLTFSAGAGRQFSGDKYDGVKWSKDGRRLATICGNEVYIFGSAGIAHTNPETLEIVRGQEERHPNTEEAKELKDEFSSFPKGAPGPCPPPPFAPQGKLTQIDLQSYANQALNNNFHRGGWGKNTLVELPKGKQMFAGIDFFVGRKLIHLGSQKLKERPLKVEGIVANVQCSRLYFLHAAAYCYYETPKQIGRYVAHYEDGTTEDIPIVAGRDVLDWWRKPTSIGGEPIEAWQGENPATRGNPSRLALYVQPWDNPRPDKAIKTIDFVSANEEAAPFCVAITAEHPAGKLPATNRVVD